MKHIISLLIVLTVSFSVSFASAREWTAASGHKITGDFVKCENGTVEIKLADTKTAEVKLEQLSDADREFVRQEIEKAKKAEVPNPFVVKDKPAAQPPAPVEGNIENITADTAYRKGIEARNAGNIEEAKKWLRKAAELGDAFADGQLKRLDAADTSDNDYPLPYGIDGKYGYVSRDCVEVIPRQYDSAEPFSEGLALVKRNGKWGFIDKSGKEITELKYDDVGDFSEELTNVKRDGKYGFIDKTGKEIIEPKYEFAWGFSEGLAAVKKDGKGGFIDKTGKEVIEYKYDDAGEFREGLATVRKDGKWGFIDKTDKEVIEPKYESAWGFSEGLALVKRNGKWGFIDKTSKEVIECKYDDVWDFSEELAPVRWDGKWGFIDKTGKEVISFKYESAALFREGLAAVEKDGKWGMIDKTGKEVVEPQYESIELSKNAIVVSYGKNCSSCIDKNGTRFIPKGTEEIFANAIKKNTEQVAEAERKRQEVVSHLAEAEAKRQEAASRPATLPLSLTYPPIEGYFMGVSSNGKWYFYQTSDNNYQYLYGNPFSGDKGFYHYERADTVDGVMITSDGKYVFFRTGYNNPRRGRANMPGSGWEERNYYVSTSTGKSVRINKNDYSWREIGESFKQENGYSGQVVYKDIKTVITVENDGGKFILRLYGERPTTIGE